VLPYFAILPVTPGELLSVTVGAGGPGGAASGGTGINNGVAGGLSQILRGVTVLIKCPGGLGGNSGGTSHGSNWSPISQTVANGTAGQGNALNQPGTAGASSYMGGTGGAGGAAAANRLHGGGGGGAGIWFTVSGATSGTAGTGYGSGGGGGGGGQNTSNNGAGAGAAGSGGIVIVTW
jgi:hypothetical protein